MHCRVYTAGMIHLTGTVPVDPPSRNPLAFPADQSLPTGQDESQVFPSFRQLTGIPECRMEGGDGTPQDIYDMAFRDAYLQHQCKYRCNADSDRTWLTGMDARAALVAMTGISILSDQIPLQGVLFKYISRILLPMEPVTVIIRRDPPLCKQREGSRKRGYPRMGIEHR
jgi:hypothetical protein